jgi:hydroxyacylglutathione hydrolase
MNVVVETFPIGNLACNCSILYSPHTREAIAIDPGDNAQAFLKKVRELNVTVKYVLHTHAHFDHIGHSDQVREALNVPLYLHKQDLFLYEALQQQAVYFGQTVAAPKGIDHYLEHEEEFFISTQQGIKDPNLQKVLKTIHTPGHTPGSCSFYTEALDMPLLFTGDTLFANSVGRTDLPGGDFAQIITLIKQRLLTLPPETVCIPGHGKTTDLYHESKHNRFLL